MTTLLDKLTALVEEKKVDCNNCIFKSNYIPESNDDNSLTFEDLSIGEYFTFKKKQYYPMLKTIYEKISKAKMRVYYIDPDRTVHEDFKMSPNKRLTKVFRVNP